MDINGYQWILMNIDAELKRLVINVKAQVGFLCTQRLKGIEFEGPGCSGLEGKLQNLSNRVFQAQFF